MSKPCLARILRARMKNNLPEQGRRVAAQLPHAARGGPAHCKQQPHTWHVEVHAANACRLLCSELLMGSPGGYGAGGRGKPVLQQAGKESGARPASVGAVSRPSNRPSSPVTGRKRTTRPCERRTGGAALRTQGCQNERGGESELSHRQEHKAGGWGSGAGPAGVGGAARPRSCSYSPAVGVKRSSSST